MSVHIAHLAVLAFSIFLAAFVYALTRHGLEELLARTVGVPGGIVFYNRAFLIVLLFGAIGSALSAHLDVKPGEHFMEYVWDVASAIGETLTYIFMTLAIYLVLMTILVATLKPKNDQ